MKIKCPKCGNDKEFVEITDGLWRKDDWQWNTKTRKYRHVYEEEDGNGDNYVECSNCGKQLPHKLYEKFFENTEFKS